MYFEQTWPSLRLPIGHGSISSFPMPGSGLIGLPGLGQEDPTEGGECPEPVSPAERDALLNEIKGWTGRWEGPHFHEGHPDVKAIFNDIVNRLHGLEKRPKLLRCKREARDRANNWIGQLKDLQRRINKPGIGIPYSRSTWVRITEPFQFTVYRGPTYTVRPGTPHPEAFAGQPAPASPTGPTPSSAPPGSVVINGQVYASSAAAAAAQAAASTPPGPEETTGTAPSFPLELPSWEGEIFGVPTKFLILGVGGVLAYKFLFAKGR